MKKIYNLVLTVVTIILLIFISFTKLNASANWVDFTGIEWLINIICNYGPMVMLCLFAFGSMIMSKFLFIIILVLLLVFSVCMFAPDWLASVFGAKQAAPIIKFLLRI